jgi:plasmid stabilization system protein ParE
MTAEIRLRREAEQDLTEAAKWYDDQRTGLGEEFLNELRATLSTMADMPSMYPMIYRSTRRAVMHRFPFSVSIESMTWESLWLPYCMAVDIHIGGSAASDSRQK